MTTKKKNGLVNRTNRTYSIDNNALTTLEDLYEMTGGIPRTRLIDKAIFQSAEIYKLGAQDYFDCLDQIHRKTGVDKRELIDFSIQQLLKHYVKDKN
ncbi:hypothetical protein BAMA_04740 [Bacillus manliponensis]|uniref:Uncharacterized protein n=1 Tax=Bacillus manliponensis TaxID=574376 RepID=A0A073JWI7_9BACI|nr:ribbon-helix-helix domain-containing protein [Bacillus manliponensis]KEK18572.1 hypothetical protein BAMA_04740 [Bacillus manliponensis]